MASIGLNCSFLCLLRAADPVVVTILRSYAISASRQWTSGELKNMMQETFIFCHSLGSTMTEFSCFDTQTVTHESPVK